MSEVLELKGVVIKFNATAKDYDGEVLYIDHNDPKEVKCLLFKFNEVAGKHRTFVVVPDNNFNEIGECLFNDYTMLARMLENHPIMNGRTLVGFNFLLRRDKGLYPTTLLSYKGENNKARKRIIFERYVKTCCPEGGTRYNPTQKPTEEKPEPSNKQGDGERRKNNHPFKKNKQNEGRPTSYKDKSDTGPTQMAEKLSAALATPEVVQPGRGDNPTFQAVDESGHLPETQVVDDTNLHESPVDVIIDDAVVEQPTGDGSEQVHDQEEFDQA